MRDLILVLTTFCLAFSSLLAQSNNEVTAEDYERMIKNTFEVEFRELAIEVLGLEKAEIKEFTPIYLSYMEEKAELMDERNDLVKAHKEAMSENQSAAQIDDETADFVENYMEIDIDEMQLEKDYFDKFEDNMTYNQALRFFNLEKGFRSRIARAQLAEYVPVLVKLEPVYIAYEMEERDFNKWKDINIDGRLSLDHNFTHDGLTKLLDYAAAMVEGEGINIDNFDQRRMKVMKMADEMHENWNAEDHAEMAREAFIMTAKLLRDVHTNSGLNIPEDMSIELLEEAKQINPNILYVNQSDNVYNFFDQAEKVINRLTNEAALNDYDNVR